MIMLQRCNIRFLWTANNLPVTSYIFILILLLIGGALIAEPKCFDLTRQVYCIGWKTQSSIITKSKLFQSGVAYLVLVSRCSTRSEYLVIHLLNVIPKLPELLKSKWPNWNCTYRLDTSKRNASYKIPQQFNKLILSWATSVQ